MTQYTRSVVPGRGTRPPSGRDLDRLVFGDAPPPGAAPARPRAANEDDAEPAEAAVPDTEETYDDDMPIRPFADRSGRDRRESKGRRRGDYSRLPDGASFRAQDSGGSGKGIVMLVAALVVVGVFGGVVWNAYREGVRGEDMVSAPKLGDEGPFKVRPAAEKPRDSAALEATVFERFEAPAKTAEAAAEPAPDTRPAPPEPSETLAGKPAEPAQQPAVVVEKPVQTAAQPKAAQSAAAQPVAAKPAPEKPAAVKPVETAALPPVQPASSGGFTPGGKYLVQIGASASEAGADEEWSRWKGKGGALFTGAEKIIVRADVSGRTVYRVRVGSFATVEAADSFCAAFKGKGGDCFRATR
jgi:hypothetical protein